jgi:serine/threonine protein kinase
MPPGPSRQESEETIRCSDAESLRSDAALESRAPLRSGTILDGKYRIERELGKGGMGAVYLATHLGTTRTVAVKVIIPEYADRDEFVVRFQREAAATGRLRHPNVVNVTDFGVADAAGRRLAYLVMEYLDGETLAEYQKKHAQMPLDQVLDVRGTDCSGNRCRTCRWNHSSRSEAG